MQICKQMEPAEAWLLRQIQLDTYYALLIPLTVPVSIVAVRVCVWLPGLALVQMLNPTSFNHSSLCAGHLQLG